jgi:hypothetical protein
MYFASMPDKECLDFTGFTKAEFLYILNHLKNIDFKNSPGRTREQALAIYLFWLKTGISQEMIKSIFNIKDQQTVSSYCQQVREALMKDFVPQHLGIDSFSRKQWLDTNTGIASVLYDLNDIRLCTVADGTYCYCEKPADNYLQRLLYSGQKKRHLVKIFIICATNGRIIDVFGPFAATMNDASILKYLMEKVPQARNIFQDDDVILLDRGFRDILKDMRTIYKTNPKSPPCK